MNNYIANLSLRGKFLLIAAAMLVPITVLSFMAARLEVRHMNAAIKEDIGLEWASELITIAMNLSEYREHAIAVAGGSEEERGEMVDHQGFVHEAVGSPGTELEFAL